MISLKDYAAERNISYEAVRKSVTRYKDELEGHITVVDRTQYLDDEAVAFLDERRKKNPVVIIQQDKDEKIAKLEEENKALLLKVNQLQDALIQEKDKNNLLQEKYIGKLEAGEPQAAPELESRDEITIDVEPGDPAPEGQVTESLVGVLQPEQKPGFAERFKLAWKILKGE